MASKEPDLLSPSSSFYLIGNIPASLHSADLRAFFSRLVEGCVFVCFHYKHRPEHSRVDGSNTERTETATKCCVAVLKSDSEEKRSFISSYSGKNWLDSNGDTLPSRVRIQLLTVTDQSTPHASSAIPWGDLQPLPELNPPSLMPQGNVGTPLQTFMELIRSCKLPGHVIKKLRLEFPKSRTTRRYGAVRLDYGNHDNWTGSGESSVKGGGQNRDDDTEESDESETIPSVSSCAHIPTHHHSTPTHHALPTPSQDDDHDAEEWERYESLHDDVDKQVL